MERHHEWPALGIDPTVVQTTGGQSDLLGAGAQNTVIVEEQRRVHNLVTAANECLLHLLSHLDAGKHQHGRATSVHLGRVHRIPTIHIRELFVPAFVNDLLVLDADVVRHPRHPVVVLALPVLLNLGADHMEKLELLVVVLHALESHSNLGRQLVPSPLLSRCLRTHHVFAVDGIHLACRVEFDVDTTDMTLHISNAMTVLGLIHQQARIAKCTE